MKKCVILALGVVLGFGCGHGDMSLGKKSEGKTLEVAKVSQRQFATYKDLISDEWVYPTNEFSTDDEKIIVVARLDKDSIASYLSIEILDPENNIISTEMRRYDSVHDMGIAYNPGDLVNLGGGPGLYKAKFYSDSRKVGEIDFMIEDTRDIARAELVAPELKEIEWLVPGEAPEEVGEATGEATGETMPSEPVGGTTVSPAMPPEEPAP